MCIYTRINDKSFDMSLARLTVTVYSCYSCSHSVKADINITQYHSVCHITQHDSCFSPGSGTSKKLAKRNAAAKMLSRIHDVPVDLRTSNDADTEDDTFTMVRDKQKQTFINTPSCELYLHHCCPVVYQMLCRMIYANAPDTLFSLLAHKSCWQIK